MRLHRGEGPGGDEAEIGGTRCGLRGARQDRRARGLVQVELLAAEDQGAPAGTEGLRPHAEAADVKVGRARGIGDGEDEVVEAVDHAAVPPRSVGGDVAGADHLGPFGKLALDPRAELGRRHRADDGALLLGLGAELRRRGDGGDLGR